MNKYTTSSGKTTSLARNVTVVDATEHTYILKNYEGVEMECPKYLLVEHDMKIVDGKLQIPRVMYEQWFTAQKDKIVNCLSQVFEDNLRAVIEKKHIVLENPNYFQIRVPLFYVYMQNKPFLFRRIHLSIGAWLSSFDKLVYEVFDIETEKKKDMHIVKFCGESMEEINDYLAWDNERMQLVKSIITVPHRDIMNKFVKILIKSPSKERVSTVIQLKALLVELGIDISNCMKRKVIE